MEYVVAFAIGLPISIIILIGSMLLTSKFMGGVEFGTLGEVVVRGGILLIVINLVCLIPYGIWLALPVWWFGLMILFRIDFWEARTLVVINWLLNLVVNLLLHSATLRA
jgi:hypothetical protein